MSTSYDYYSGATKISPEPILPTGDDDSTKKIVSLLAILLTVFLVVTMAGSIIEFVDNGAAREKIRELLGLSSKNKSSTPSVIEEIPEYAEVAHYLNRKYNDNCVFANKAQSSLPEGAIGGEYTCENIQNNNVFAYVIKKGDSVKYEDGYVYAKNYAYTWKFLDIEVGYYHPFKKYSVYLINSLDSISTNVDPDIYIFDFIATNNYEYHYQVYLSADDKRLGEDYFIEELKTFSSYMEDYRIDYYLVDPEVSDYYEKDKDELDGVYYMTAIRRDGVLSFIQDPSL